MHRFYIYILLFSLFLSCQKENKTSDYGKLLQIVPSVSENTTKALVTDITGQSIGIQVTNSEGTELYDSGKNNLALSYSASVWNLASTIYLSSTNAKIYAYAPYSSTTGDFTGIGETSARLVNMPASQAMASQTDYLWASQSTTTSGGATNINKSNSSVTLTMNHALAQIAFVIYKSNYSESGSLTQIAINDNSSTPVLKIYKSSSNDLKMSLKDGTISGGQTSSSLTVTGISNTISLTSDPGNVPSTLDGLKIGYILAVPVSIADASKITFTFTIDGKNYTVAAGGTGSINWLKGNQYIYKAKLSSTGMTIESISVNSWSSTSDASLYPESKQTRTANCYIVAPNSTISIPVNIKGNGGDVAGTGLSVTHTAASVAVLWQTSSGLITIDNFNSTNQRATICTNAYPSTGGNAVLAAYSGLNATGTILWSWHIWVTEYDPDICTTYNFNPNNNLTFMDRNLGATDNTPGQVGTQGLFYQWGRKDPFPNSTQISSAMEPTLYGKKTSITLTQTPSSSNLSNSIYNPATFYYYAASPYDWYTTNSSTQNNNLWGPAVKTIFDPCPYGWRVPAYNGTYSPWSAIGSEGASFSSTGGTWTNYGASWTSAGYYPASGYRDCVDGVLKGVGQYGCVPSATTVSGGVTFYRFTFSSTNVYTNNAAGRSNGFSMRCVKE